MCGFAETKCKPPCLKTIITIHTGFVSYLSQNVNTLYFGFNPIIRRKVVTLDKFDFMISLNFLGSNLGLWPGLGLFQIVQQVIIALVGLKAMKKIFGVHI